MKVSVMDSRTIHGWLSREVFMSWVIHGPWTHRRRPLRAALTEALALELPLFCQSEQTWL